MTEKKSKKNTKREIRKVIYRIHSVVFCVWKMNLSSQSYFMVQCVMSHSGSVWHLFLGERCTTILKKKKKVRYFWSMRFVLLFASLLNLLAVRQHTRSCIQYRPTEEKSCIPCKLHKVCHIEQKHYTYMYMYHEYKAIF